MKRLLPFIGVALASMCIIALSTAGPPIELPTEAFISELGVLTLSITAGVVVSIIAIASGISLLTARRSGPLDGISFLKSAASLHAMNRSYRDPEPIPWRMSSAS